MDPMLLEQFIWLAPFIFFAGLVDSIAGGGGLISVPAYLAMGINPAFILGTNKLSSSVGTIVSTTNYLRKIRLDPHLFVPIVLSTLIGSALGARTIVAFSPDIIRWILLLVVPVVALLLMRFGDFGATDRSAALPRPKLLRRAMILAGGVGFYDGFFGPGTGTFLVLGLVQWLGFDLLRAAAYGRYLNFASNLAALAAFLWSGHVLIPLGLSLGLCGMVGHLIGSNLAIRRGHGFIRPVLIAVLIGLLGKVLWDMF